MAGYLRRCKDCHSFLDVRNIDWRCCWCGSQVFADTIKYGLMLSSSTGSRLSSNQTDRDESPIVHHTPPGARHALLARPMSRAVDDIPAVSVSASGFMPRSTGLVEAPSVTEGSQCPPQRPTTPPTPEFVTPVSSPQMSAISGGDMTPLSLGSPATQGSGAFLPTRQTTAAQGVEGNDLRSILLNRLKRPLATTAQQSRKRSNAMSSKGSTPTKPPPERKKESDPYGGLTHHPELPSPEYRAGKVDWYPDLFVFQIRQILSPYHKRLIARIKARWSADFQCLRSFPDNAVVRQSMTVFVQEAWDVFKEYVPYWTSDPDWIMPSALEKRLQEMQVEEAVRGLTRRNYELDREVDYKSLFDQNVVDWSSSDEDPEHPQVPPNSAFEVKVHFAMWVAYTRGQLHADKVAQYFVWLDAIEERLLEKVDQFHALRKGQKDDQTLESHKREIAQAFHAYREAVKVLVRDLNAKVEQLNDLVTPTLESFKHEKGRIIHHFNNFEQLVQLQIHRLYPEGEKTVGNLFAALREGTMCDSQFALWLQGTCLLGVSPEFAELPRFAWPLVFTRLCKVIKV